MTEDEFWALVAEVRQAGGGDFGAMERLLKERLESRDATLTLVKHGDHRLSEPEDLARLARTLDDLLADLAAG